MRIKYLFCCILLFLSFSSRAEELLYGEFIHNLNMDMRGGAFEENIPEDFDSVLLDDYEKEIIENLLEEARWVFSGMIYGFSVEYTPSDRSRAVNRYYNIEPLSQIKRGDPRLEIYNTFIENRKLHLFIRYKLDDYQYKRIVYWNSGVFSSVAAYGTAPYFSEDSRINAIKDAIRISLENYLKPLEYNKPRLIEGEVLLRNSPSITISTGDNRAFVNVRLNIKNVQHYYLNN